MKWGLVLLAGCAGGMLAVPFEPGTYRFERVLRDEQSVTEHRVSLVLDPGGSARAVVTKWFIYLADHDGELARDDRDSIELAGRWVQRGEDVDVALDVERVCASGFGERPCAHASRTGEPWRLRCRAMTPRAADSALVCGFRRGVPEPRFTTIIGGERVLVVLGPERAAATR